MKKKFLIQKLVGVGVIFLCVIFLFAIQGGDEPGSPDGTAALLLLPAGFYMIFGKKLVIE